MSYRARLFNRALVNALGGSAGQTRQTDFLSDTVKCALLTDSWTPDLSLETYADLTNELTETGYTAAGTAITSKTVTYNNNYAKWVRLYYGAGARWAHKFTTARYGVFYNSTPTDKPLLGYVDAGYPVDGALTDYANFNIDYTEYGSTEAFISLAVADPGQGGWTWYGKAWANIFGGVLSGSARQSNYLANTMKVALLTSSYAPLVDSHETWAGVSGNEVTGTGYTAGGLTLTGKALTFQSGTRLTILDCDDLVWTSSTITAHYAVLYNDTPTDKPLFGYLDLLTDQVSSGGTFRINTNPYGLLTMKVT